MSSQTPDWNAPGQGGSAYLRQTEAEQPQWRGQQAPVGPVDEAATRVTGRRVLQYVIDYILVGIIPGLGWLLATVIALAVYYWYWVERPLSHRGQSFGMQLLSLRVISKDGTTASRAQLFTRGILLIVDTFFFGLVGFITMI